MVAWRAHTRPCTAGLLGLMLAWGCRGDEVAADGTGTETDGAGTVGDEGEDESADETGDEPVACSESVAPRQLRLLTRREYDATVHDLFSLSDPETCSDDAQCHCGATCDAGACGIQTVPPTSMVIPGQPGWSTLHVAGSFNDWPGTLAEGGWALEHDAETDTWTGTFDIPAGQHQYKLVIDESEWIADPTNPVTVDDGFGGDNSVLDVEAEIEVVPPRSLSFTEDLPLESRPSGYAFDNNASAGLVTSVHAEQFMRAAQAVAAFAVAQPDSWLPCQPQGDGAACAEQVAQQVGRRVYRRPLDGPERAKLADMILGEASFEDGLRVMLQAMLASPYFLYRFELGEEDGEGHRLTGYEVATALSYGLWGTMPDDTLLDAADSGALDTREGIEAQVSRLLADPRARALVGTFAVQWLGVERIATADKNAQMFPDFDASMRASALEETRRFVAHVVFDGTGRFDELLEADYGLLDAGLAALYGVATPDSPWSAVPLPAERRGLLSQASVLGSYAYSDQTSPVRRGLFVRHALLCQDLPPPPPDAGGVPEVDPDATTRERFSQHMDDPACFDCHRLIDPVGFGFEHFDPVGAWRDLDAGKPVDASGELSGVDELGDAAAFDGLAELSGILGGTEAAPACFARHYFRFTHGRLETADDDCALETLSQRFAEEQHDIVGLIAATFTAPEFLHRQ